MRSYESFILVRTNCFFQELQFRLRHLSLTHGQGAQTPLSGGPFMPVPESVDWQQQDSKRGKRQNIRRRHDINMDVVGGLQTSNLFDTGSWAEQSWKRSSIDLRRYTPLNLRRFSCVNTEQVGMDTAATSVTWLSPTCHLLYGHFYLRVALECMFVHAEKHHNLISNLKDFKIASRCRGVKLIFLTEQFCLETVCQSWPSNTSSVTPSVKTMGRMKKNVFACIGIKVYKYMCVRIHIHRHVHIHIYIYVLTYIYMLIHIYICIYI